MKKDKRSKSCLYLPTMRCTHPECIKANSQATQGKRSGLIPCTVNIEVNSDRQI